MPTPDFIAAIEEIDENPKLTHFVGPMPAASVAAAEQALGVTLPASYKDFLLRFGAGNYGTFEVYGLPDPEFSTPRVPNAVWYTLQERKSGLPKALVVIGADDEETAFCLDTAAIKGDDAPIVSWQEGKIAPLSPTFSEYFRENVETEAEEVD